MKRCAGGPGLIFLSVKRDALRAYEGGVLAVDARTIEKAAA